MLEKGCPFDCIPGPWSQDEQTVHFNKCNEHITEEKENEQ